MALDADVGPNGQWKVSRDIWAWPEAQVLLVSAGQSPRMLLTSCATQESLAHTIVQTSMSLV